MSLIFIILINMLLSLSFEATILICITSNQLIQFNNFMEREIHQSSSGAKINLYSLFPMGEVRAVIHITHGMAEHAIRYSRFASELTNAGYAVFAHDYERPWIH